MGLIATMRDKLRKEKEKKSVSTAVPRTSYIETGDNLNDTVSYTSSYSSHDCSSSSSSDTGGSCGD